MPAVASFLASCNNNTMTGCGLPILAATTSSALPLILHLYLPPMESFPVSGSQFSDIMELETANLMKNQHYRELHKQISNAVKALADVTHMTSTLHQEDSLLKVEVQSLKLNGMANSMFIARSRH